MRVQEHFRFLTQRFAEVFFIQFLNIRVVVRFAQRFVGIFPVKGRSAPGVRERPSWPVMQRLPATSDAAAGACHDFDDMIFIMSVSYIF